MSEKRNLRGNKIGFLLAAIGSVADWATRSSSAAAYEGYSVNALLFFGAALSSSPGSHHSF